MSTPVFPSYAKISSDGFVLQRSSAVQRTDMESGPPKQSKYLSRVMVTIPVKIWFCSKSNYLDFIDWFNDELNRGSEWFEWNDPVSETTKLARFVGGLLQEEQPTSDLLRWTITTNMEMWDD